MLHQFVIESVDLRLLKSDNLKLWVMKNIKCVYGLMCVNEIFKTYAMQLNAYYLWDIDNYWLWAPH